MQLSVIVPSIRPGNLENLYYSIEDSFTGTWELVVVSPYKLPRCLQTKENISWIEDWGSPVRAQQKGLLACQGDYISWAADDGVYLEGALEIGMKSLEGKTNTVVVGTYNEGAENPVMADIEYYYIYTHEASRCRYIPKDCLMLMVGIVPREILLEVGGFDCQFEALPMAFNDLSIRLYNRVTQFIFQEERMFKCGHMPGRQGDHAPIHDAQTCHDTPIFKMIYTNVISTKRVNIDLNNWEKAQARWTRRFGEEKQNV